MYLSSESGGMVVQEAAHMDGDPLRLPGAGCRRNHYKPASALFLVLATLIVLTVWTPLTSGCSLSIPTAHPRIVSRRSPPSGGLSEGAAPPQVTALRGYRRGAPWALAARKPWLLKIQRRLEKSQRYFWPIAAALLGLLILLRLVAPTPWGRLPRRRRSSRLRAKGIIAASRPSSMRVFCLSDVHSDIAGNMEWVQSIDTTAYRKDVLICAGDISDNLEIVEATLTLFKERFREVFFTPGNHELWLMTKDREQDIADSLQKFHLLGEVCRRLNVHTTPQCIMADQKAVWIVPMHSWYHKSWDPEPDITPHRIPGPEALVRDFRLCKWPEGLDPSDESIARRIDEVNDTLLSTLDLTYESIKASGHPVISFSHFLPHIELIPEKRYLFYPNLAKAVGSTFLAHRVGRLQPLIHVFGHTHFGWDMNLRGVRYIQAALGYPTERQRRMASLEIGAFPKEPLLIYDADIGPAPPGDATWSDHYRTHPRTPYNVTLAPWVSGWSSR